MKTALSLFVVLILSACAGSTLKDPKALEAIQHVKIYENLKPEQYRVLKKLEGLSCGKTWWDHSSKDEAIKFLKAAAVASGLEFDGLTNVSCTDTGWSWKHNCNNSFTCTGDAIKL